MHDDSRSIAIKACLWVTGSRSGRDFLSELLLMIISLTLTPPACSSHSRLLLLLLLPQIPTPSTLLHAANTTLEVARCSAVPLGSSSATRHSRCARVLWSMGLMPGPCLRLVSTCRATRGRYLLSMAACVWSMILWTSSAVPHFPWPIVALLWISCAMPSTRV